MKSTKSVLYLYGIFLFITWNLVLLLDQSHYDATYRIEGILFMTGVVAVLFICNFFYHRKRTEE